jgi:hypothetical protein
MKKNSILQKKKQKRDQINTGTMTNINQEENKIK